MTTTDRATVLGVFPSQEQAEQAVEELHRNGFDYSNIGLVTRDSKISEGVVPAAIPAGTTGTPGVAVPGMLPGTGAPAPGLVAPVVTDTDASTYETPVEPGVTTVDTDDTANRIAAGATGGGLVGGLLGAAASLLIPGLGPITAAGILVGTLTGLLAGSVTGGLIGALTGLGVSEEDARYYHEEVAAGRVLVTVNAPGRQAEVREILRRLGATDTETRSPFDPSNPVTQPGVAVNDRVAITDEMGDDYATDPDERVADPAYTPERVPNYQRSTPDVEATPAPVQYDTTTPPTQADRVSPQYDSDRTAPRPVVNEEEVRDENPYQRPSTPPQDPRYQEPPQSRP